MDEVTIKRQAAIKRIEYIEGMPSGPERWKEIRKFYFELHPEHIELHTGFCKEVREMRENEKLKLTGASKSGELRHALSVPEFVWRAWEALDPTFFDANKSKSGEQESQTKKIYKAFPEYRASEAY